MITYFNKDYKYSNRDKKMLISLVSKNLRQLSNDYINMHLRIMHNNSSLFNDLFNKNKNIFLDKNSIDMNYRKCAKNTEPTLKKIFSMYRYNEVGINEIDTPLFPVTLRLDIDSPLFKNNKNVFDSIEG